MSIDENTMRQQFEEAVKHLNYPLTPKGYGYRSPMTQMAWSIYQSACIKRENDAKLNSFQQRVWKWLVDTFGSDISANKMERTLRVFEEVCEMVQAADLPHETARALLDEVYSKPPGELHQEVGGVMTTLSVFCHVYKLDMIEEGEREYRRILPLSEMIFKKNLTKKHRSVEAIDKFGIVELAKLIVRS